MKRLLVLGFALALGSLACGSSDDDKDTTTGTGSATSTFTSGTTSTSTSGTCKGAASNSLIGSCSLLGQCFEMYSPTAPTADITKATGDACTGYGTWSTGKCAAVTGGCTCTDTTGIYKTINYYSDVAFCEDCTSACESKQ